MNKKIIVGVCLLILVSLFSGCVDKITKEGKIVEIQSFGGGYGHKEGVTLIFDDGTVIQIGDGIEKVKLNTPGIFHFEDDLAYNVWRLIKVEWIND